MREYTYRNNEWEATAKLQRLTDGMNISTWLEKNEFVEKGCIHYGTAEHYIDIYPQRPALDSDKSLAIINPFGGKQYAVILPDLIDLMMFVSYFVTPFASLRIQHGVASIQNYKSMG